MKARKLIFGTEDADAIRFRGKKGFWKNPMFRPFFPKLKLRFRGFLYGKPTHLSDSVKNDQSQRADFWYKGCLYDEVYQ